MMEVGLLYDTCNSSANSSIPSTAGAEVQATCARERLQGINHKGAGYLQAGLQSTATRMSLGSGHSIE